MNQKMNEKIKIIIVDDEYLERNLLKNCIDWEKLGMEIVGEASNADDALNLIDKLRPDIVFTDINMPIIDGLKLSGIVLKQFPDIKIVVVTGFDDFDYAQKSIKIGISDFIVKPISDDDVYKTALNLKEQIEKKRSDKQEYSELRHQLLDNLPYIKEKFYNELIKGEVNEKSARARMTFLGVTLGRNFFQIAAIECSKAEGIASNEESQFLAVMQILNMAKDYFKGMIVFFDTMSRIIVINSDENTDLYEDCELFKERVIGAVGCTVCIGLGAIKKELCEISVSYKEALDALKYKSRWETTRSYFTAIYIWLTRQVFEIWMNLTANLAFYIKSCLLENATGIVDSYFDSINLETDSAVKEIRITAINIVSICLRLLSEAGIDADYIYKADISTNSDIIMLDTLPEAKAYVDNLVKKSIELTHSMNKHKISDLICEVKKYIDENFADSKLSLTTAAKKVVFEPKLPQSHF